MFKVFEKGTFYDEKTDSDLTERELVDSDIIQAVMQRNGNIMIIETGIYNDCFLHVIENDEDDKYRVERI